MTMKRILIAVLVSIAAMAVLAATDREAQMLERLSPIGDLCMAGDSCASAPLASASSGPKTPEEIYNTSCTLCHATGITESPILGNVEQWAPRIAQGMDTLYEHALVGFNAMPMKGACMTCSDEEIIATVDWMVEQSQ
jgi:cytochrome c5